jgi:GNAT superfamily N-acetyltransferase
MSNIIIRDAGLDDAASLAELAGQLGYPSSAQNVEQRLASHHDTSDERLIVAESEGRVVGWTNVGIVDHFYISPYAEISGLVVEDSRRGEGIGARLIDEAIRWAKVKNVGTLRLRANTVRVDAHRFYLARGFEKKKTQVMFEMRID